MPYEINQRELFYYHVNYVNANSKGKPGHSHTNKGMGARTCTRNSDVRYLFHWRFKAGGESCLSSQTHPAQKHDVTEIPSN